MSTEDSERGRPPREHDANHGVQAAAALTLANRYARSYASSMPAWIFMADSRTQIWSFNSARTPVDVCSCVAAT